MAIRNALGRGLDSLIPMDDVPARGSSAINNIPLDRITPNPDQPRTTFDEEALAELAASIRELGIIQPLSLRKTGADTYQIIAGERRFRAARMAGLSDVPAYIRTANEAELTEMALIENIQREDLNAIEIALTFKKLIDQYNLTQERLSERVGKKRATVANFLRLLRLRPKCSSACATSASTWGTPARSCRSTIRTTSYGSTSSSSRRGCRCAVWKNS